MKIFNYLAESVFKIMSKTRNNKKVNGIINAMKNSRGKFFTLTTTTTNRPINAQFVSESTSYVTVRDRNAGNATRKFAKRSLSGLKMGEVQI